MNKFEMSKFEMCGKLKLYVDLFKYLSSTDAKYPEEVYELRGDIRLSTKLDKQ